nr:integrase, catalytic region, zinc finger, CCHC-type, peptidase aspartic, catalytic [Tanacetum cinerariifolium]
MQLKQEVFQNDKSCVCQNASEIPEYFEKNDLKAQLKDKDTTICKLKDTIKSLRKNNKEKIVDHDRCDLATNNEKLENSMAKLLSENERLCEEINHVKQDKVFVITSLKNNLRKLKGKATVDNAAQIPFATIIVPGMFKLDLEPLSPKLMHNRESHIFYLKHTQDQADILRVTKMNESKKSKSAKKQKKQNVWKPMGHLFTKVGLKGKPTGRTFTIAGNSYPLTRFGNDQIARIMRYGDYQLGNVVISRVYYVEALRHNFFSVVQFCDADPKVAFQKNTCFIHDLEGVNLIYGSRDTNLYSISLDDMLKSSSICLLSKASKTKIWLWLRRLSHLNFGTLNKLAKDSLARGILRLKFQKDHLCSACALGKSIKSSHQPKAEDTNQEKLYLLHMDLCGPMRVASINEKRVYLSDSRRLLKIYLANVIGNPSRSVSIRKQLETDALWCYFDAFLSSVEPKNFKQVMIEPSRINAMQEEIHEFERLEVWKLLSCLNNVFLIKLKWIYKIEKDESGGDNPSHVYKIKKAHYGLKQAPRAWYDMLSSFLISQQFSKGAVDLTLFIRHAGNNLLLSKYASKIIKKYGLHSTDYVDTPMIENKKLDEDLQGKPIDATLYRGMVGSLMYLTVSKPDLIYIVYLCARYQAMPTEKHLQAVKRSCGEWNRGAILYRTEYQLADIFTIPLPRERFNFLIDKLGKKSMSPDTLKRLAKFSLNAFAINASAIFIAVVGSVMSSGFIIEDLESLQFVQLSMHLPLSDCTLESHTIECNQLCASP